MDKKYIHIDDLSRQLLGQREEEPRPGAWMTMRELLDKEMPVGAVPVAGFAWRRYLSAALILLLLSIATIGGYQWYGHSAATGAGVAVNSLATTAAQLPQADAREASQSTAGEADLPAAAEMNSGPAPVAASVATVSTGFTAVSDKPTATALPAAARTPAPATMPATTGGLTNVPSGYNGNAGMALAHNRSSGKTLSGPSVSAGALPSGIPAPASLPAAMPATPNALTVAKPAGLSGSAQALPNSEAHLSPAMAPAVAMNVPHAATAATGGMTEKAGVAKIAKGNKVNQLAATQTESTAPHSAGIQPKKPAAPRTNLVLVRDTIRQIQVVQRQTPVASMRRAELKFDTISITDLVQERWVQAGPSYKGIGPMPESALPSAPVPNSAAKPALKTEDGAGSYVALSSKEVARRKWSAQSITLRERMQNTMLQLSQIRAYTGMVAGVGFSPSATMPTYGFHLGLFHAFQLDQQWTLSAEFTYKRRMGKDLILRDDYSQSYAMNRSVQGNQTVYNWRTDSVEHYFKVSALQSIVVPVNLQYNLNRLFLTGGVQFSYSPRINSEEIKRYHNQPTAHSFTGNPNYTQMPPGYQEGVPAVKIDDFGGRMGLGLQVGVGYELSPALKLDVRCAQQFWDNARTPGARKVSKEFYRLPNLQLTVGYRFGKSK